VRFYGFFSFFTDARPPFQAVPSQPRLVQPGGCSTNNCDEAITAINKSPSVTLEGLSVLMLLPLLTLASSKL